MKLQGTNVDELRELGLDVHDIYIHQERIQKSMERRGELFIPIQDTYRLDNHGILPPEFLRMPSDAPLEGYVAFVPAAGAASRYFKPLLELRHALEAGHQSEIQRLRERLRAEGAAQWPLPPRLESFFEDTQQSSWDSEVCRLLIEEIDLPKALLPCWKNGPTFLEQKADEHQNLEGLDGEVYVTPFKQSDTFVEHLAPSEERPCLFLEQGPSMSTIRFHINGRPYRDADERLTLVPAGHGMLVKLFPDIHRRFPGAHSLFIRNIDNVNGSDADVVAATELFLRQHQLVLRALKSIRGALHADNLTEGARIARDTLNRFLSVKDMPAVAWVRELEEPWRSLWCLLMQVFHLPPSYAGKMRTQYQDKRALRTLYDRPLNTLGQVPNSGKDIGGTAVLAQSESGEVSICLELPHVSSADRERFLENPKIATHFNPAFVAAEIPTQHHSYDLQNCPFWILAEKNFHGHPVVYHEIVLYEILGNSLTSNVLFPEIPRILFNPHKTLLDGLQRRS